MLKFAAICGIAAVSAVGAAQAVVSLDHARRAAPERAAVAIAAEPLPEAATGSGAAAIAKAADGHFWAQANVNGSAVTFLVDTGASAVALSPDDARRLGFSPTDLVFGHKVMTATGEARAARVKLKAVSVGGARVENVDAFVIESGLTTSLLGMSYLGRLARMEATPNALILRT